MYIWFAIGAYLLYAVNGVIDKFLLSKAVSNPVVYAFYIGITGSLTWFLLPFGFKIISPTDFVIALIGGASFIVALYFLYSAILQTNISRILPLQGGLVPVFTLLLAYLFLGERLSHLQLWAFALLVAGGVLIVFKKDAMGWHAAALKNGIIAAALFALSLTLTKYIFDQTSFVSGLIWTRLGFVLVSLIFLLSKNNRKNIFRAPKKAGKANVFLYYGARLSGGAAGLLQNYAIAVGSVTIVNALQGTQYALLLILTIALSLYFPKILKEEQTAAILAQKIIAIALIGAGLAFLTM